MPDSRIHTDHPQVEIIAHRGASSLAPENTLASVNLAWKLNADAVEIDVRLTRDNRIVLLHDATTTRTTGKNLTVSSTLSEELRKLDAGGMKSKIFTGQTIPFLEEVLHTIPRGRTLLIEIKCGEKILPVLRKSIIESGKISQITLCGFDRKTIAEAKKLMEDIHVYWLCRTIKAKITQRPLPHDPGLIDRAKEHNFDGLSMQYGGITGNFAKKVLASGLKLYAWTVNTPREAERLMRIGVHGLVTDRPGWLREQLEQRSG